MNHTLLSFLSGIAIGAAAGGIRLRSKLRMYRSFVEERLQALNASEFPGVPRECPDHQVVGLDSRSTGSMSPDIVFSPPGRSSSRTML